MLIFFFLNQERHVNMKHLKSKSMVSSLLVELLLDWAEFIHFNNHLEKLYFRSHVWVCSSCDNCHTEFLIMLMHLSAVSMGIFLHPVFLVDIWSLCMPSLKVWQGNSVDSRSRAYCSPKCCQFWHHCIQLRPRLTYHFLHSSKEVPQLRPLKTAPLVVSCTC